MSSMKLAGLTAALLLSAASARADVEITNRPTANMSCVSGVCTATAQKAVLNVSDLQTMLASGDVAVKTGSVAKDIDIDQPLSWSSTARLTLDAQQSVTVKKQITVAGAGALTIATSDGGSNGDLLFVNKGSVTFWDTNSSLIINGQSYTLVKDIATLAADIAANPSGFYALANSYDAKHDRFDKVPIPTEFSGTLDGLEHSIVHLTLKHQGHQAEGLFGRILAGGTVRDLILTRADVSTSKAIYAGALVGQNFGTIANVTVDGVVTGTALNLGGIVGANYGTVFKVNAAVLVTSHNTGGAAGGIAGTSDGTILRSRSTGAISADGIAGGLVGSGTSSITLCYATGAVNGLSLVGGLAGGADSITQSFATGDVSADGDDVAAGGLVGVGSNIDNSYATGQVHAGHKSDVGGLVGFGEIIGSSYSTGAVGGQGGSAVGGFLGKTRSHQTIQDYWDLDTSGISQGCGKGDCSGVTGLSTKQLQSGLPNGFVSTIWGEAADINDGLPYLLALPPLK